MQRKLLIEAHDNSQKEYITDHSLQVALLISAWLPIVKKRMCQNNFETQFDVQRARKENQILTFVTGITDDISSVMPVTNCLNRLQRGKQVKQYFF